MVTEHPAVAALLDVMASAPEVVGLYLTGSAANGTHVPGVSDLDLVALTSGPLNPAERRRLVERHRHIDAAFPQAKLGCVYLPSAAVGDTSSPQPTWTHGRLIERPVSSMALAEVVTASRTLRGLPAAAAFPAVGPDDLRAAARAELRGYWRAAVRHPWWYLDPNIAELSLLTMARARHTIGTGELISKRDALRDVAAPPTVRAALRARRVPAPGPFPRRGHLAAWLDALRTVRAADPSRDQGRLPGTGRFEVRGSVRGTGRPCG